MNKLSQYCLGRMTLTCTAERALLIEIQKTLDFNSGKVGELYVENILKRRGLEYISQPRIKYSECGVSRFIQPDFYLPKRDLFIEVKSRTYTCPGTASEKIDHVARKYSTKLKLTEKYKDSKVLVVFCAGELLQPSTIDLLNYNASGSDYTRCFVEFTKQHSILDWISVAQLDEFLL